MLRAAGILRRRAELDQAAGVHVSQKVAVGVVFVAAMFMSIKASSSWVTWVWRVREG
jgi:hypothetical protein